MNAAILDAVAELLGTTGYADLTMEAVAARAGVHRATLYRRWPNKEGLVAEALLAQAEQDIPVPNTGDVREDLRVLVTAIVANLEGRGEAILRALVGEASRVPQVMTAGRAFWDRRLALAGQVVARGVERGELPANVDVDQFVEEMVAPIFFRLLVTGRPVGQQFGHARVERELELASLAATG